MKKPKKVKTYIEALKRLTPAEIRVLDLVEQGLTSIEIAKKAGEFPADYSHAQNQHYE